MPRKAYMNLDWLVVGGGVHGVHIAARLIGEAGIDPDRLRIVDPADQLLSRWRACTSATGMLHLRSPSVHHLDVCPWSLHRFASMSRPSDAANFTPPYDRPALSLFNAHSESVVDGHGLARLHIKDRVTSCTFGNAGATVGLSDDRVVSSTHIVLAIGVSEQPHWPAWAPVDHANVRHLFESGHIDWPSGATTVCVVGGGISACQAALRLCEEGHNVHLISRHALRQHQFDSDPGWLGPKYMVKFNRVRDLEQRRAMIRHARHRGSVPPDVHDALMRSINQGRLAWHEDAIEGVSVGTDGLSVRLSSGQCVQTERLLLATGFDTGRPGGAMVDNLMASMGLRCAPCGFPIVDTTLCWHPGLYVTGPLAELELGPASRNIAGARRAGDRLVAALRAHDNTGKLLGSLGSPGSHRPPQTHL